MPDPVEHRPLLPTLSKVSKSLSDLRGRYQRGARAERDDFGTPWQQTMLADVPPLPPSVPHASPPQTVAPPLPSRARAKSNASSSVRLARQARKETAPPLPTRLSSAGAAPVEAHTWPCARWAPRLGPNQRFALAMPPSPSTDTFPGHFDAATIDCVRRLITGQCSVSSIDMSREQTQAHPGLLKVAARFVALQCIEKREQLKREHQKGERDARSVAEHREALLEMLSQLVDAKIPLGGPMRETSQRTLAHFACLWADEQALKCLLRQDICPIDLKPLFDIPTHGVEQFCKSLRASLSIKLPELEALCAPMTRNQDDSTAHCYRLIIGAFAAQVPHHTSDKATYAQTFLLGGFYFFSGLAVHSRGSALIEGLLQAAWQLDLQQHVATTALQMCLQNGFLSGASKCLKPSYQAATTLRVVLADGSMKLDFGFPAERTPLHLLAEQRYGADGASEKEAVVLAEALHDGGADARALSLVNILPNRNTGGRDTLVSATTLALLHDNMELAKRLARLAQRRDQQEKLASLAAHHEAPSAHSHTLRWRAELIAATQQALAEATTRLNRRRGQMAREPGDSLGAAGDIDKLFATLRQIFERVFSYNLAHGFGLRDTGEVRFARAISQLRAATEVAHTEIAQNHENFDDVYAPRIDGVMFFMQRAISALRDIDVHRCGSGVPISLAEQELELFEDGATNLHVLRQDDRFGTLRPLPLLATLPSPSRLWVETYLRIDRQKATYDCVAAFALSIGGTNNAPLPTESARATGRVPPLARHMLETFDVTRKDWDVLLTGYLMAALRQHHGAAVMAVIDCAERCIGGLHKLPLEEIPAVAMLAIDTGAPTLRALLAADRRAKHRFMNQWKVARNAAGETLLHVAARKAGDQVAVLFDAARDSMRKLAYVRDLSGRTPAQVALACGQLHAFFSLWELRPQLDVGVELTLAGLQAVAGPGQAGLRYMAQASKSERLRGQLMVGLLMAAVWHDEKDCLARLLGEATWQDCIAFADGANLLHLVASSHAPMCFDLLQNYTDTRLSPSGELFRRLAERPDQYGGLPDAVARDERVRRRIQACLAYRGPRDTPNNQGTGSRASSPKWGFQGKSLALFELHRPHGVVMLSKRPTGHSASDPHQQFSCQRQAVHMMLRQPNAAAREQLVDTFLHNPELLEWARPSADEADPAARENLAWELVLALDQAEAHKAFGVRLRAQMPDVSVKQIRTQVRQWGRSLGRFASSDPVPLLALRQAVLALCDARAPAGAPMLDDAADMAVTVRHPNLRALCVRPSVTLPEGVECRQTGAVRFEVRRHWQTRAIEILDMSPVVEASVEAYGYDQLQPISQALS